MGESVGWEDWHLDDVGRKKPGTSPVGRVPQKLAIGIVGAVYLAALYFDIEADGGREAALFFGTAGFVISFPILLLLGKLVAAVVGKGRKLGADARTALIAAPALMLAGLLAYEGYRSQEPVSKFRRWIASPAPPGLRIMTAYTYKGSNYWNWAFHFTVTPDDLPKILARRPYQHEVDPAGFDLRQVRANGRGRPGYPIPPPDFQAIHRYHFHAPSGRVGYDVLLYVDAPQTEFYAYGYVE
jgi:hypothetical protein